MKKFKVTVQQEIIVEFDENSKEFKEMFEGYKSACDPGADFESLAKVVALDMARYGRHDFIEGIGYIKYRGQEYSDWTPSGGHKSYDNPINVDVDVDLNGMVDYEAIYIEEIEEGGNNG